MTDHVRCPKCGTERPAGRPCPKCLLELGLGASAPRLEQVGPYRVLSRLGAGAMGEVYRARDPRLDRDVAIKVLPESLANDSDRVARFRREARVAASLNHPNIAAIYGFEEVDSAHFLVMELVEGETLADRLARGAIPIDEALRVVEQIAEGLEAAHDNGVIHRDLKPSNVKLTPDGKAKILDFGLAKALDEERPVQDLERSPTVTAHLTEAGMVFGTVPYMSPEQARGRPVDRRSDIWALGCVLFECLAGGRAFDGETATDVLAKIIERDPDWSALPARTPPRVRELLERCLAKDLRRRVRDAGDVRIELERAREAREWTSSGMLRAEPDRRRSARPALPWALAGLSAAIAIATIVVAAIVMGGMSRSLQTSRRHRSGVPLRVDVTDPDVPRAPSADNVTIAISPDGTTAVYLGINTGPSIYDSSIYVRTADAVHASHRIDRPTNAFGVYDPFFSPDGKWIGFSSNGIYKVPVSGGRPVLLVENLSGGGTKGATWTQRGIVFSPAAKAGLVLVGENGGVLETMTVPDAKNGEVSHRWPSALPDGRHLLFTIKKEGITSFDQGEIALLDVESGTWTTLLRGGSFARYLPTGHIVFARGGAILAVPFDLRAGKVTGPAVTVLEGVMTEPGSGAAQFAVASEAGTLLYVPGGPNVLRRELLWVDRQGGMAPCGAPLAPYDFPLLSPDASRVASTLYGATDAVIVYNFLGRSTTRLPVEGNCSLVCWHPDGRQLLLRSDAEGGGKQSLFLADAGGGGASRRLASNVDPIDARLLARLPDGVGVISVSENSIYLTHAEGDPRTQRLSGVGDIAPQRPALSPDGRWLAYETDVSGRHEVYVRPFPSGNGSWQISRGGGVAPIWAPDGREILYQVHPEASTVFSVRLTVTPGGLSAGPPSELFKIPADMMLGGFHPDGRRLVAAKIAPMQFPGDRVVEILNWFDQVQEKTSGH